MSRVLAFVFVSALIFPSLAPSQQKEVAATKADDALDLEKLFPEKGLFGPSASGAAFSHDGRHAAFLWRPYPERRHGSDLWLLDVASGDLKRVTSVSVMSRFLKSARKVGDDRVEKARKKQKAEAKKAKSAEDKSDTKDEKAAKAKTDEVDEAQLRSWRDTVQDKDADDEKAPRYAGISGFEWAPKTSELLFVAGGDVFRLSIDSEAITRLTVTRDSDAAARWIPEGSGFYVQRENRLQRVRFGNDCVEEVQPPLPAGESLQTAVPSPDGAWLAILTRKGESNNDWG
ncbi:MAG: hypothetical protein KDB53_12515, partial [Planctomycetes bacterium]|nr:hypothetical protein [Planctomycetota bacterium]